MKIEFLLLPEDGEQSERKNEQIPCSPSQASRCWPSGHAAGGETAIATWNLRSLLEPAGGI